MITALQKDGFTDWLKYAEGRTRFRPFVGEQLWSISFAYIEVLTRIGFLVIKAGKSEQLEFWLDDAAIRQILSQVLSPEEISEVESRPIGAISRFKAILEAKFLRAATEIITGKASADMSLAQARRLASESLAYELDRDLRLGMPSS